MTQQLQLELPDYSYDYEEYLRKKEAQEPKTETVIIIENF
jgi:hypothetical protein